MDEVKTTFCFRAEDFSGQRHDDDECPICKCKEVIIKIDKDVYGALFEFKCGHTFLYRRGDINFFANLDDGCEIG